MGLSPPPPSAALAAVLAAGTAPRDPRPSAPDAPGASLAAPLRAPYEERRLELPGAGMAAAVGGNGSVGRAAGGAAAPPPKRKRTDLSTLRVPTPTARPATIDVRTALASALDALEATAAAADGDAEPPQGTMAVPLLPHQRAALAWALTREAPGASPRGGLLLDDQGMGKTVTTAALIACAPRGPPPAAGAAGAADGVDAATVALPPDAPMGGTLVIVPTTLLAQWGAELGAKLDQSAGICVVTHYGPRRATDAASLAAADVVLTTYGMLTSDLGDKVEAEGGGDSAPRRPAAKGPLLRVRWGRAVADEAHQIRNPATRAFAALEAVAARARWALTGTPCVNGVADFQALFRFVRHAPYNVSSSFTSLISAPLAAGDPAGGARLTAALHGVALRRTKHAVSVEREVEEEGRDGAAAPPSPSPPPSTATAPVTLPGRTVTTLRIVLPPDERARYDALAKAAAARVAGGAATPINMLTLVLRLRQACDHPALARPRGTGGGPSLAGAPPSPAELAVGAGLAPKVRAALVAALAAHDAPCAACGDAPDEAAVTPCRHVYCRQCGAVRHGGAKPRACAACGVLVPPGGALCRAALEGQAAASAPQPPPPPHEPAPPPSSAKIDALLTLLRAVAHRSAAAAARRTASPAGVPAPRPEKTVVFSSFTGALDLVGDALAAAGLRSTRVDGTMAPSARDAAVQEFTDPASHTHVLLASLKAAGVGLNLAAANHVVLFDAWWARAVEDQAIDRAHRIGQTRDVRVTRLVVADSVEERVVALADRKAALAAAALGGGALGGGAALSKADLQFLFAGAQA